MRHPPNEAEIPASPWTIVVVFLEAAMAVALPSIQAPSPPLKRHFLRQHRPWQRNRSAAAPWRASGGGGGGDPGGDKRQQELLAMIAMLQAQKVRVSEFLDERKAYLTQYIEDAGAEFDEINRGALQELEDSGARLMEKLDGQMQAYEEAAEISRQEIENTERLLSELEDKIERDRNEGLFFRSLGKPKKKPESEPPPTAAAIADEVSKVRDAARDSAGIEFRRKVYIGLMSVLAAGIVGAVVTVPDVDWRRVAGLGLIFVGLVAQLERIERRNPRESNTAAGATAFADGFSSSALLAAPWRRRRRPTSLEAK